MPLQKDFKGLPDHIGMFLGGRVPIEFFEQLVPTFSAEDFVNTPVNFRWSGSASAQAFVVAAPSVPEGEVHRVRWIGGEFAGAGANAGWLVPAIFHLDGWFGINPTVRLINATPGDTYVAGAVLPQEGLYLTAGMAVGWQVQELVAAAFPVRGIYQAQVIRV